MMVWGFLWPYSMGRFRLEGLPEGYGVAGSGETGWHTRLRKHYYAQTPEVQRKLFPHTIEEVYDDPLSAGSYYSRYATQKLHAERGSVGELNWPPFNEILEHEWPKFFECHRTPFNAGSLIITEAMTVDASLKGVIEELEPNMHEFHPLELETNYKAAHKREFFTAFVGQTLDSLSPEESDLAHCVLCENGEYRLIDKDKAVKKVALRRSVFGSAHLWIERRIRGRLPVCFSDELYAAIKDAGLAIPRLHKMREIK